MSTTNRYPGTCQRCGADVPAGTGIRYRRPPFATSPWLTACGDDDACAARKADKVAADKVAAAEQAAARKVERDATVARLAESFATKKAEGRTGEITDAEIAAVHAVKAKACVADFPKTIEFEQGEGWKVRFVRRAVKGGVKLTHSQVEPDGAVHVIATDVYDTEAEAKGKTVQRLAGSLTFRKDRESVEYLAVKSFVEANR